MPRFVILAVWFALLGGAEAQAQTVRCPEHPRYTVETFKERLLELARTGRVRAVGGLVSGAMTPSGVPPSCHILPEDEDLDQVLDELIRFVVVQPDPDLHLWFFTGVSPILNRAADRPSREIPLDALVFAVEEGRSNQARGRAVGTLERRANDPEVFALLLEWARAESGPPAYPNLPEVIAGSVYVMEAMRNAEAFRAALESDLSLIRNPREEGRSGQASGVALSILERLADEPRVFELLLEWARAETGPPRFPNRPEVIAGRVYVLVVMRNAEAFRAALESDLSLIRNPHVRCRAEHGRLPPEVRRQTPPDCPPQR